MRLAFVRLIRWAGLDGNPLRRGIDRTERAAWTLLVIAFTIAAPVLVPMAGRAAKADSLRLVRLERSWRQVSAVLLKHAPRRLDSYNSALTVWVPGRWQAPAGGIKTGLVPTAPGTPAGSVVRVWVTASGQLTGTHPFTADLVGLRVVALEVLTAVGLALSTLVLAIAVRWLMNRRRMTYWAIEWACFGPRWSARRK